MVKSWSAEPWDPSDPVKAANRYQTQGIGMKENDPGYKSCSEFPGWDNPDPNKAGGGCTKNNQGRPDLMACINKEGDTSGWGCKQPIPDEDIQRGAFGCGYQYCSFPKAPSPGPGPPPSPSTAGNECGLHCKNDPHNPSSKCEDHIEWWQGHNQPATRQQAVDKIKLECQGSHMCQACK